jgi:hypothetical protein
MIFNRSLTFKTSHKVPEIKQRLLGRKVHVHQLDFEVVESNDVVKIIPHAEDVETLTTLPITHVKFKAKPNETEVRMSSHPRRIDAGGPYILMILVAFTFIAGASLYLYASDLYGDVATTMMLVAGAVAIIFWIRMELGYFDYVRKLHRWLKTEA